MEEDRKLNPRDIGEENDLGAKGATARMIMR